MLASHVGILTILVLSFLLSNTSTEEKTNASEQPKLEEKKATDKIEQVIDKRKLIKKKAKKD